MKQARNFLLLLAPLLMSSGLMSSIAHAEIYRSVDEHGEVSFSDTPIKGGKSETVTLEPLTVVTATRPMRQKREDRQEASASDTRQYQVAIVSPATEHTVPKGPGIFSVSADVTPALDGKARLQLLLDGVPYGLPQTQGHWTLEHVVRGAHLLNVEVIDQAGNSLATSTPTRVYVLRPTIR